MKLKNIILVILAMVLVSVITVGITVAYLTDTDKVDNVITLGDVDIELREYERVSVDTPNASAEAQVQTFNDNKPLLPAVLAKGFDYAEKDASVKWDADKDGNKIKPNYTSSIWDPADINNEVDKMVFVENTGKSDAYVRVFFAFEAGNYTSFMRFKDMVHINLNDAASEWTWEWNPALATSANGGKYFIATATYLPILKSGEFTTISLSQIALDPTAVNKDVLAFGEKYEVSVFVQGIQTVGFDNSDQALTKGFGDDIPFTGFTFETGVTLKTALHYLNGEEVANKKITANVSTVTFGLNKDHKNITSKYNPTFIGSEQDVAVYSYYVKNDAGKYDIYVLADSKIYTPKSSEALFRDMTALTTVNTANMDVSRTENMRGMFYGCSALVSIDTSSWDTSSATIMERIFQKCAALSSLDVAAWDVSNVTSFRSAFNTCEALTELDVAKWDVSNVTNMQYMFSYCKSLQGLNITEWNVSSVTDMQFMFNGCESLTELNVSKWIVKNVTTMHSMFQSNESLTTLDVSEWNTSKVTDMSYMFYGCGALTELNVSKWDVSSVENMDAMFYDCSKLSAINVLGWKVDNVTTMFGMFDGCAALQVLDVSNWNVINLKNANKLFNRCAALTTLNMKSWNTSNLTDTGAMFANCSSLATIYVDTGWNMDNVTTSDQMFKGCSALVGAKGTAYDANRTNKEYAHIDGGTENPGYFTYKPAESTTPEQN